VGGAVQEYFINDPDSSPDVTSFTTGTCDNDPNMSWAHESDGNPLFVTISLAELRTRAAPRPCTRWGERGRHDPDP